MAKKKPHIPDFKRVDRALKSATKQAEAELTAFANRECARFTKEIRKQEFQSFADEPLSPAYAAYKDRAGLDPRTMIATDYYNKQVRVFQERKGNMLSLRIGMPQGKLARRSDGTPASITLEKLAQTHEYGSAKMNIPARPHWTPFGVKMRKRFGTVKKRVTGFFVKAVKSVVGVR